MGAALGLTGILAILAAIVLFIIAIVRRKGWHILWSVLVFGIGMILFIAGLATTPTKEKIETAPPVSTTAPAKETPSDVGKSRLNPVPFGSSLTYGDERLSILGSRRVSSIGYSKPKSGNVYLVVKVKVDFIGDPTQKRFYVHEWKFRVVGSSGFIYDTEWYPKTDTPLKTGEFYGGATVSGELLYEIDQSEIGLVLIWNCGLGADRYFEIR